MTTKGAVANETCRAVVLHALRTRGATGSTIESAECETAVDTELLREAESSREAGLAKGAFHSAWGNKVIAAGCPRRAVLFPDSPCSESNISPARFPRLPVKYTARFEDAGQTPANDHSENASQRRRYSSAPRGRGGGLNTEDGSGRLGVRALDGLPDDAIERLLGGGIGMGKVPARRLARARSVRGVQFIGGDFGSARRVRIEHRLFVKVLEQAGRAVVKVSEAAESEQLLDGFQHRDGGEARVFHEPVVHVRRDDEERRAMRVDVVGAVLGVVLEHEDDGIAPEAAV